MNEDKLTAVARYQEGDLDTEETTAFEAQLQNDMELQDLLAHYKEVHQTLKAKIAPDTQDQAISGTLSGLNQQYFKTEQQQSPLDQVQTAPTAKVVVMKPYLKYISIAAVLLIGVLVWAPWSGGLYEKYAFSKQMSVAERGADQQAQISKAAELYNKGDFAAARKVLLNAYSANPENPMLSYYFAITLIETGQAYEARTLLMHLFQGDSVFKYDAAFYVALSFVKEDKKQDAILWLEKIPQENTRYGQAQELIGKLGK